jgi:hypothetical protein
MNKETLEEASIRHGFEEHSFFTKDTQNQKRLSFYFGAKWQAERMYSEEEVEKLLISCKDRFGGSELYDYTHDDKVKKWFEQFKKK